MSEIDIAKKLFGTSGRVSNSGSAPSRIQNQTSTTTGYTSTRYGTVQAIEDNNYLTILLDGSDEPIKAYCETPVVVGQRVSVVFDNGTVTVIALSNFVEQVGDEFTDVRQEIEDKGQQIIDSVQEDMEAVQGAADQAKQEAEQAKQDAQQAAQDAATAAQDAAQAAQGVSEVQTTVNGLESDVEELTSSVSAATETANGALTAATTATQTVNSFKTEVSQTYETKADADAAMAQEVLDRNSAITQSANSIKQEVSENYINNETGATLATKTELTTAIDGVTSTVSQNYVNKNDASKTYATKTEVTQTKDSILQSVSDSYQVKGDYATADDIDSAIAAEVVNRNAAIETKADQITQTVSETYQSKTDAGTMESSLQAQIKTQADRITQEVSDRKTAVSGAVQEAKSYTDQQAESITTTVMETVDDAMGQTYATKSEVQQTADGLNLNISSALTAANNAQADVNGLSDVVSDNSETVANVNAYFQFGSDAEGNPLLTLGSSESEMKSEYSNKALSFKSNGNEVMRLDGSTSTVTANKMQMGNYQWNGEGDTLRLIYVGGE